MRILELTYLILKSNNETWELSSKVDFEGDFEWDLEGYTCCQDHGFAKSILFHKS